MTKEKTDLVYGTLDMLILKAIQLEPRHGLGIADRIHQMSDDVLRVEQGSLYPVRRRAANHPSRADHAEFPRSFAVSHRCLKMK